MRHRDAAVSRLWLLGALGLGLACVAPRSGSPPALGPGGVVPASGSREIASGSLGPLTVRKWRLSNGLDVITVPDAGARSISYVTTYRVGSRDEDAADGKTGLAHLCEHLLFTGAPRGQVTAEFDQRLEEAGGTSNAMTSHDFTSYVDDIPPRLLERTVHLEADRMVNLELSPAAVASERDIVVEERLQSSQDDIDGELEELVYDQAFRNHPYRFPVIGRMADIKAVTRDSVHDFYKRHYGPSEAVVILAGQFDEAVALPMLAAVYGALPAAEAGPAPPAVNPERPEREVRSTIERPVPADRFMMGLPAPGLADPDRATYEVLDELMTGGQAARLYRALIVDRDLASSLEAELGQTRDPGLWTIVVQMMKGQRAETAEQVIRRELEGIITAPVPDAELGAARNRLETAFWRTLSSSQGRAQALGQWDVVTGDFRNLLRRGAAYAGVSPADLSRVARAYLASGARSVVIARPKGTASP